VVRTKANAGLDEGSNPAFEGHSIVRRGESGTGETLR